MTLQSQLVRSFSNNPDGDNLTEVSLSDFGKAASVEITKNTTTVVDGEGDYEKVDETIEKIKVEIQHTEDMHEAGRLQDRITRLSSGVAIIRVGASSEVEMIEKKHRIEDALGSSPLSPARRNRTGRWDDPATCI